MRDRYQVRFELTMNADTALNNYEYLDILDRAWSVSGFPRPSAGVLCDVGCASFWYVTALAAFFSPREIIGVEIDGHRLFKDGRARIDYASGYLAGLPRARFLVADYNVCELPADVIVAWFPFVTAAALLAWRLPLSFLTPGRLFERVFHNLRPGGMFVMINHGETEADLATAMCTAANLRHEFRFAEGGVLSGHRERPAILSCWSRI